ncbi:hypothetical protein [Streptomyces sp. NBC_00878]|uniref:hypothetical protein n=1 Tax=Streptomyces sp. NBC_00878 TaxID=2975854 RepID=UPI00225B6708|nr:hypothetical protein [Streptomyces sp. NBC_00878]MCX4906509.1 hypothetical protein [Streptomyces sp. NBC_00878]
MPRTPNTPHPRNTPHLTPDAMTPDEKAAIDRIRTARAAFDAASGRLAEAISNGLTTSTRRGWPVRVAEASGYTSSRIRQMQEGQMRDTKSGTTGTDRTKGTAA